METTPDIARLAIVLIVIFGGLFLALVGVLSAAAKSFWKGLLVTTAIYAATAILVSVIVFGVLWAYDFNWEAFVNA